METFTSRGIEIRYRCVGQGEPVLLIHGFGQSPSYWGPLLNNETQGPFSYYVVHLKSFFSSPEPITFSEQVSVLKDWIENVVPQRRFHLVGASYGGALTWALRLEIEPRVLSHTLINPMPLSPMQAFRSRSLRWVLSLGYVPGALSLFLHSSLGHRTLAGMVKIFRMGLAGPKKIRHFNPRKLLLVEKALQRFFWIVIHEDWQQWQKASSREIPTQILYGDKDHLFAGKDYESYLELMPSALVRPFPGLGHLLLLRAPKKSAQFIEQFLRSS